ncbi:MAG: hypothetical protein AAF192_09105, partial [Pseudomonadota bacterium]
ADLVSSCCASGRPWDFNGLDIADTHLDLLDLRKSQVRGVAFSNCILNELTVPVSQKSSISFDENCIVSKVIGATSMDALPPSLSTCQALEFDSARDVAKIRQMSLPIHHKYLVSIIKKTFFQPGAARQQEALYRGLGKNINRALIDEIAELMVAEGLLQMVLGRTGQVFVPNRAHTNRMQKVLSSLSDSEDPIWSKVSQMD